MSSVAAPTASEIVDAISALEDAKARACAEQARLTARLQELTDGRGESPTGAASLVGYARRESPARGRRYVGLARALVDELPATLAAMEAGALSEWRATLIVRETACLSPDDRARVDILVCTRDLAGGYPFHGWGDQRLVDELRRHAAHLDPAAVVDRRAHAERERRVSLRPAPDTMAQLTALLPAAQGVAVRATLTRVADQLVASGDGRSRGQIMADTLVERVTGQERATAVPVTIDLVVSDETLLAGGTEPAWLSGYGTVTAQAARDLTRVAADRALARLRRLYATPDSYALVAMDARTRLFPAGLATFIGLRDRTCRTPWCDAPIRHTDHVVDAASAARPPASTGRASASSATTPSRPPVGAPAPSPDRPAHLTPSRPSSRPDTATRRRRQQRRHPPHTASAPTSSGACTDWCSRAEQVRGRVIEATSSAASSSQAGAPHSRLPQPLLDVVVDHRALAAGRPADDERDAVDDPGLDESRR